MVSFRLPPTVAVGNGGARRRAPGPAGWLAACAAAGCLGTVGPSRHRIFLPDPPPRASEIGVRVTDMAGSTRGDLWVTLAAEGNAGPAGLVVRGRGVVLYVDGVGYPATPDTARTDLRAADVASVTYRFDLGRSLRGDAVLVFHDVRTGCGPLAETRIVLPLAVPAQDRP